MKYRSLVLSKVFLAINFTTAVICAPITEGRNRIDNMTEGRMEKSSGIEIEQNNWTTRSVFEATPVMDSWAKWAKEKTDGVLIALKLKEKPSIIEKTIHNAIDIVEHNIKLAVNKVNEVQRKGITQTFSDTLGIRMSSRDLDNLTSLGNKDDEICPMNRNDSLPENENIIETRDISGLTRDYPYYGGRHGKYGHFGTCSCFMCRLGRYFNRDHGYGYGRYGHYYGNPFTWFITILFEAIRAAVHAFMQVFSQSSHRTHGFGYTNRYYR